MAYVLYHNERFLIEPMNPVWRHYQALGLFLLAHGVAGGSALILAPMQFSERLRMRFTNLHRVIGRIYVRPALWRPPGFSIAPLWGYAVPLLFAIGGSDGFSKEARHLATSTISLGKMTFPHELARVVLLEQLYRAFTILSKHPYHLGH